MLTPVGTGGCGRTRLAIELARTVLGEYPDGVWLVELAAILDPRLVAQQLGAAVGVREAAGRTCWTALPAHCSLVACCCL
jgi:predicted ATPase